MFNSRRRLVLICVGLFGIVCVFGGSPVYQNVPSYITEAEDFPINGTLFNFTATDSDNDDITVGYGDPATLDLVDIRRHCNSTCNHIFVEVKLRTSLDFDNKAFPNPATIKLTLTDLQFNRINVQLSVYITDVNDNSPEFNNQPYTWSIPERPFENNTYTKTSATDKDSGTNGFVTYDLQPTAQSSVMNSIYSETFSMDKTTGTVTLLKQLDYETNTFYQFKVIAVDGGGRNSTTDFIVRVRDAQDTAPYFNEIPYRASIHENSNTWVLNVSAVDGDHGIPNTVSYSIEHGSCSSLFEIGNIDSKGVIHTRQQIDRDSGVVLDESGVCILQVLAEERNASGIPQYGKTTATTNVTIIIEDENDNSPTFDNDVYTARVRENTVQDVPITLNDPKPITVHDKDQQTEYSKIKLSVRYPNMTVCYDFVPVPDEIQGSGSAMILVNNTELLDFEVIQDITFLIIATESANASHVATATVSLSLIDVNDNNPKFEKSSFVFHVNESSENGTYVNTITATDADSNSDISYSISGGYDRFIVDSKSGQIAVNCKNCLDDLNREVIAVYYMTYTATDSGKRSTSVPLVINLDDINDNTPTFLRDNYNAFVLENDNMSLTTPLVTVSATDKDLSTNGNVTYDIMTVSPSEMKDNLTINATSGYLFLKSVLDFEKLSSVSGSFNVTVKAEDSGHPPRSSNTTVIITVQDKNDNSPVFNQTRFSASILENSTSSPTEHFHVCTMAAYDLDGTEINRELRYFIVEGAYERFSIDSSNGTVYVQINAKLDRETLDNYNITIIAIDQGSPSLTGSTTLSVHILDVNDEDPSFNQTSFTAAVFENTNNSIGASVTTCFARDPDKNKNLNYTIIKVKGKDEAGNEVNTTLINDYFGIKENNGTVYTRSITDRETAQTVTLTVQVEDMNAYNPKPQTATATLTITLKDINDNYPVFAQTYYEVNISENARDSSILTTIKATDKDVNRTISYNLVPGKKPTDSFSIVSNTGILTKIGNIDREKNATIELRITATDDGVPSMNSTVTVNVNVLDFNDNAPVFTPTVIDVIHVPESKNNGSEIIKMNATDADSGPNQDITFTIESGAKGYFKINETTGAIYISNTLDRERTNQYILDVTAADNPTSKEEQKITRQKVTVYIDDINDNPPKFKENIYAKSIPENVDIGTLVVTIGATDLDEQNTNNSKIIYSFINGTGVFVIHETSGAISVNISLKSLVQSFIIGVMAEDCGNPRLNSTTYVNITVLDVNLNKPVVGNIPINNIIKVYECEPIGHEVHRFNYTDKDHGINAEATFTINEVGDGTSSLNAFKMYANGSLQTNATLDASVHSEYRIQVQATDYGTPALSSHDKPIITIKVIDVDDHLPTFLQNNITMSIKENGTIGQSVGKIKSVDEDKDSIPCYRITGGDGMDNFTIGYNDGEVNTTTIFDREIIPTIVLTVNVTDCYNDQISDCRFSKKPPTNYIPTLTITIDIVDINDNPPVFTSKEMNTGMRVTTEAGDALDLQLKSGTYVKDLDTPEFGKGNWTFQNGGNITISSSLASKVSPNDGAKPCDDNKKHIVCITGNGTIVNNKYYNEDMSGYFIVPVKVSDAAGSDTASIKIYLIGNSQILVMTVMQPKEMVSQQKDDIMREYSRITGHQFVYDFILDHKTSNGQLQPSSSDLYFHVVKTDTQEVLSGSDARDIVDKHYRELVPIMTKYYTGEVNLSSKMTSTGEESSSKTLYILVAVIAVLTVTIAIIIFVSLITKNKYKMKLKVLQTHGVQDTKMEMRETSLAIPGSNQYSRQANPLLNKKVMESVVKEDDAVSVNSNNSLDSNDVDHPRHETVYDTMEEREVVMDMFTEDTFIASSAESPLDAVVRQMEQKKNVYAENMGVSASGSFETTSAFTNDAYLDEMECTEI